MHLCYIDESGTPQIPGNTSHFVLAGLQIPVWLWRNSDNQISQILEKYSLQGEEVHTAWICRSYPEQAKIANFEKMDYKTRRREVERWRTAELLKLQKTGGVKLNSFKKQNSKTSAYIHLSRSERFRLLRDLASAVSKWGHARLFAECIDKIHFDPKRAGKELDEQAFEQVVSRFETFLQSINVPDGIDRNYGLLIHDNNQTAARQLTDLMQRFHQKGTAWTSMESIIETPLFVDSQLTRMVQIADLCAYALRRYLENGEEELFELIFNRADTKNGKAVGVRHFTRSNCQCKICQAHRTT